MLWLLQVRSPGCGRVRCRRGLQNSDEGAAVASPDVLRLPVAAMECNAKSLKVISAFLYCTFCNSHHHPQRQAEQT